MPWRIVNTDPENVTPTDSGGTRWRYILQKDGEDAFTDVYVQIPQAVLESEHPAIVSVVEGKGRTALQWALGHVAEGRPPRGVFVHSDGWSWFY
jgi:hypothetical protein